MPNNNYATASSSTVKPKGKTTAYGYFLQTCRHEHRHRFPGEKIILTAFSKRCADKWKKMSRFEKQRFQKMADLDKIRYEQEKEALRKSNPDNQDDKGKKKKRKQKDPNAPKRFLSAFFWFCHDERPNVRGNNPNLSVGEVSKELGRMWASLDNTDKAKYMERALKDRLRYEQEMIEYRKAQFQTLIT